MKLAWPVRFLPKWESLVDPGPGEMPEGAPQKDEPHSTASSAAHRFQSTLPSCRHNRCTVCRTLPSHSPLAPLVRQLSHRGETRRYRAPLGVSSLNHDPAQGWCQLEGSTSQTATVSSNMEIPDPDASFACYCHHGHHTISLEWLQRDCRRDAKVRCHMSCEKCVRQWRGWIY